MNLNNREITEKNLARADSFRVQVQLKKREYKILQGAGYNWIAREDPEAAKVIRDTEAAADLIMNTLKRELRRIIKKDPSALARLEAFLKQIIYDKNLLIESHDVITRVIK